MPYKQNLLTEIDEEFQNKTPRLLDQGDYGFNKHYNNKINTCISQASNDPFQQMTMQSNNNQKTFMLEPRDESLMRKKKVI